MLYGNRLHRYSEPYFRPRGYEKTLPTPFPALCKHHVPCFHVNHRDVPSTTFVRNARGCHADGLCPPPDPLSPLEELVRHYNCLSAWVVALVTRQISASHQAQAIEIVLQVWELRICTHGQARSFRRMEPLWGHYASVMMTHSPECWPRLIEAFFAYRRVRHASSLPTFTR